MQRTLLLSVFTIFVELTYAQNVSMTGPVSGHLFAWNSLRPILGVPGAAYLGRAILADLAYAAVSPDGTKALALQGGSWHLVRLSAGEAVASDIVGPENGYTCASWNGRSSAAALWSPHSTHVQLIDLESVPRLDGAIDLHAYGERISFVSVDPAGKAVIAAVDAADSPSLYLASPKSIPKKIADVLPAASVFVNDGDTWLIDSVTRRLIEVRDVHGVTQAFVVDAGDLGDPVGIAVSSDSTSLLIADRATKALAVLDLASRAILARFPLPAEPQCLQSLNKRWYLLTAMLERGSPIYLLDAGRSPNVYFVPTGVEDQ
jgi:hypothetical protein